MLKSVFEKIKRISDLTKSPEYCGKSKSNSENNSKHSEDENETSGQGGSSAEKLVGSRALSPPIIFPKSPNSMILERKENDRPNIRSKKLSFEQSQTFSKSRTKRREPKSHEEVFFRKLSRRALRIHSFLSKISGKLNLYLSLFHTSGQGNQVLESFDLISLVSGEIQLSEIELKRGLELISINLFSGQEECNYFFQYQHSIKFVFLPLINEIQDDLRKIFNLLSSFYPNEESIHTTTSFGNEKEDVSIENNISIKNVMKKIYECSKMEYTMNKEYCLMEIRKKQQEERKNHSTLSNLCFDNSTFNSHVDFRNRMKNKYRIVVVGGPNVGKSSIITRLISNRFIPAGINAHPEYIAPYRYEAELLKEFRQLPSSNPHLRRYLQQRNRFSIRNQEEEGGQIDFIEFEIHDISSSLLTHDFFTPSKNTRRRTLGLDMIKQPDLLIGVYSVNSYSSFEWVENTIQAIDSYFNGENNMLKTPSRSQSPKLQGKNYSEGPTPRKLFSEGDSLGYKEEEEEEEMMEIEDVEMNMDEIEHEVENYQHKKMSVLILANKSDKIVSRKFRSSVVKTWKESKRRISCFLSEFGIYIPKNLDDDGEEEEEEEESMIGSSHLNFGFEKEINSSMKNFKELLYKFEFLMSNYDHPSLLPVADDSTRDTPTTPNLERKRSSIFEPEDKISKLLKPSSTQSQGREIRMIYRKLKQIQELLITSEKYSELDFNLSPQDPNSFFNDFSDDLFFETNMKTPKKKEEEEVKKEYVRVSRNYGKSLAESYQGYFAEVSAESGLFGGVNDVIHTVLERMLGHSLIRDEVEEKELIQSDLQDHIFRLNQFHRERGESDEKKNKLRKRKCEKDDYARACSNVGS